MKSKISESVKAIIDDQQVKGYKKYGITVDDANLKFEVWATHAQEELADCMIYLEAAKRSIKSIGSIEIDVLKEAIENIEDAKNCFFHIQLFKDGFINGLETAITIIKNMIDDTNI